MARALPEVSLNLIILFNEDIHYLSVSQVVDRVTRSDGFATFALVLTYQSSRHSTSGKLREKLQELLASCAIQLLAEVMISHLI